MEQHTPATIVVESGFGNTRRIAEAIAAGIGATAQVVDVADAPTTVPEDVGLLIVGGPTHALSMSSAKTRAAAVEQGGTATARGIREWIADLGEVDGLPVVVFDTKVFKARRFAGSAAKRAAKALRRKGFRLAATPTSFYVTDIKGPLLDGELERATSWGGELRPVAGSPVRGK